MRSAWVATPWSPVVVAGLVLSAATPAPAVLQTSGFRAVSVAHAAHPISSMSVAPDGRLFAAVQAVAGTAGSTPGTGEIRVYSTYSGNDGAVLDEGTLWATVANVRATGQEEGVLGVAVAPDFATSKLVYVYLTTTDESANEHVRVYQENAAEAGDYLGTVHTTLEPPAESNLRNGGGLVFGADSCLYLGVGDNATPFNGQTLLGTDAFQPAETTAMCTATCRGTQDYPARSGTNNGAPNDAGKVLRLAVDGASVAAAAPAPPIAAQTEVFGSGLRNPTAFTVHPLTGQLYVADRGDTQQAEVDVLDSGSDGGWPCLEGAVTGSAAVAACMVGHTASEVYTNHPTWRRPILTHASNPPPVLPGIAAYTGLAYPAQYYGDVFYLRGGDKIYRVDLDPPCFLPNPNGVTALAFHDTNQNGDFTVNFDINKNNNPLNVAFPNLTAIVQGPNGKGQQVLYVAGRQGANTFADHAMVFRIDYATAFTPYAGPTGRVDASCFATGVYSGGGPAGATPYGYENPFLRASCVPPGTLCPGQPDGTSCDDGDSCNGVETCQAGICRHGTTAADGTACGGGSQCRAAGVCQAATCVQGAAVADGTPCPDADPCNGVETCRAGVCQPGTGPAPLTGGSLVVKNRKVLALTGAISPAGAIAPATTDGVTVELRGAAGALFSGTLTHPASNPRWKKSRPPRAFLYADPAGRTSGFTAVELRRSGAGFRVSVRGKRMALAGVQAGKIDPRLVIGDQCFAASLICVPQGRTLRCR